VQEGGKGREQQDHRVIRGVTARLRGDRGGVGENQEVVGWRKGGRGGGGSMGRDGVKRGGKGDREGMIEVRGWRKGRGERGSG